MSALEDSKNGGKRFFCKKPALFRFPKRKYLILTIFIFARQSVNYYLFYLLKYSTNGNGCITELYFLW